MKLRTVLFLLLLSSTFALAQSSGSAAPLLRADRDFNTATSAHGLEGWMSFMTDDTVLQRDRAYTGLEAIRKIMADDFASPTTKLTWKPSSGQMFDSGTMGFTTGDWEYRAVDPKGNKIALKGQYLTVWKRQKDGSWKVLWDGGSASGPLKE